jgi:selenium metabolism protein YedF
MSEKNVLDCRGLACPQPVLRTREALAGATSALVVIVDNEGSCANVTRYAESQGAQVSVEKRGDDYYLTLVPGAGPAAREEPPIACASPRARNLVVFVSSHGMGRGDDALGAILMAAFLDTLSQFKEELSHVIFVNTGVKLAAAGSEVLEQIRHLEEVGAEVLVCGTCLRYFGLEERLAVGKVSNKLAILETLARAGRILSP